MRSKHIFFIVIFFVLAFADSGVADTTYIHVASYDAQTNGSFYTHGTPLLINFTVGLCWTLCGPNYIYVDSSNGIQELISIPSGFQTFGFDASALSDQFNEGRENGPYGGINQPLAFEWGPNNIVYAPCGSSYSCGAIAHRGFSWQLPYPANFDYLVVTVGPISATYLGHTLVYDGVQDAGAPLVDAEMWAFDNFSVHIDAYQAVPEPSTFLLLSSGLLVALRLKRRNM